MNKYLTDKNIENADLIATFQRCPFGDATENCPFIPYHRLNDPEEQIRIINTLPEEKLRELRSLHRECIVLRRTQMKLNKANSNEFS
jgi:hypothetical protein